MGGRIKASSASSITIDAPVTIETGKTYVLSVILPDGTMEESTITPSVGEQSTFAISPAFATAPQVGAIWMLTVNDLVPQIFRVVAITEPERQMLEITALAHNPTKYNFIENGLQLELPPTSVIPPSTVIQPPGTVTIGEELVSINNVLTIRMVISWEKSPDAYAANYRVEYRPESGNWIQLATSSACYREVEGVLPGVYEVRVYALSAAGLSSGASTATQTLYGQTDLPPNVTNLQVDGGGSTFSGRDCHLTWDDMTGPLFPAATFKHYKVEVLNNSGTLKRTEYVKQPLFTYTFGMNYDDTSGVPMGSFKVRVRAVNINDQQSPSYAEISASNPAPDAPISIATIAGFLSNRISVTFTPPEDFSSIEVWSAATNNRNNASLIGSVRDGIVTHTGLTPASVHYYWAIVKDVFGTASNWYPAGATSGIQGVNTANADDILTLLNNAAANGTGGGAGSIIVSGYVGGQPMAGVNGSLVVDGSITADTVGANQIISSSANLGDAVVNTLKIAGNAVTTPITLTYNSGSTYTANITAGGGVNRTVTFEFTVGTIGADFGNVPFFITPNFTFDLKTNSNNDLNRTLIELLRNGTSVFVIEDNNSPFGAGDLTFNWFNLRKETTTVPAFYQDAKGSISATYAVRFTFETSGSYASGSQARINLNHTQMFIWGCAR